MSSVFDLVGDVFGKVVDGYVQLETVSNETKVPQTSASVGVTEPAVQTVTNTNQGVPVSANSNSLDVKTAAIIGGVVLLLVIVISKR